MKIVHTPDEILHKIAEPVGKIDKKTKELITQMVIILNRQRDPEGVGLAAPQVGVSKQIFLVKPETKSKPQVFINAKIIKSSKYQVASSENKLTNKPNPKRKSKKKVTLEGCLSIPRIWGEVKRPERVLVSWIDENNLTHKQWFDGFEAVVIQHEMDHLKGILFTHHVLEQKQILYREENGELVEFEI